VATDCIHLRVKLKTGDAIAYVYQRRTRILLYNARAVFDRFQDDHARLLCYGHILRGCEIKIELLSVLIFIKGCRARAQHLLYILWNPLSLFTHTRDRLFNSNGVPSLKDAMLPVKSPAHSAINFENRVGDLRNSS